MRDTLFLQSYSVCPRFSSHREPCTSSPTSPSDHPQTTWGAPWEHLSFPAPRPEHAQPSNSWPGRSPEAISIPRPQPGLQFQPNPLPPAPSSPPGAQASVSHQQPLSCWPCGFRRAEQEAETPATPTWADVWGHSYTQGRGGVCTH